MSNSNNSWINNNNNNNIFNNNTNTLSGTNQLGVGNQFDDWDNIFDGGDLDGNGGGEYGMDQEFSTYQNPYSYRDCIIFLIDASKEMFEPNDNNEIPFHNAVKCLIQTITDKIITSESDLIGICLYNTNKKKNINDFENIYVLSDLDIPDPKIILTLEEMIENDFSKGLGHCEGEFPFCDALWTCSTMFSNIKQTGSGSSGSLNNYKRIFLFTNEDNPNAYNDSIRNSSIQRSKDLFELNIQIELFSMNKAGVGNKFDFTLFYQNILVFPDDDNYIDPTQFDACSKFSELRSKLKRKEFKKRSLGKIPLYIGNINHGNGNDEVVLSTQIYNLFSSAKKSAPTYLDPKTNLPVKQLIKNVCAATQSALLPSQIKQCYYYGGEPIIFTKDELESIKSIDRVGLTLLGFKPLESIKPYHSIKHSSFIFPDENSIKGSTVTFNALLEQMLILGKAAICRFTPRSSSSPRMVALIPQDEILQSDFDNSCGSNSSSSSISGSLGASVSGSGSLPSSQQQQTSQPSSSSNNNHSKIQFRPRGMHIIYLPYADDIRYPSNIGVRSESVKLAQQNIDAAKNIIKSMKIKFDEKKFLNPGLQKHYASLYALALERDKVEETVDNIQPDKSVVDKVLDLSKEFSDSVFPPGYAASVTASSSKRSRDGKDLSTLDWKEILNNGEIMKLTVDEIKSFLTNQGIKPSSKAKKADLISLASTLILDDKINNDKLKLLKKDTTSSPPIGDSNNDDNDDDENRPKKRVKSTTTTTTTTTTTSSTVPKPTTSSSRKKPAPKKSFSQQNNNNNTTTTTTTTSSKSKPVAKSVDDEFDIDFKANSDDDDASTDDEKTATTNKTNNNNNSVKKKNNFVNDGMFDTRKLCEYGSKCYRTGNKQHQEEFRHK